MISFVKRVVSRFRGESSVGILPDVMMAARRYAAERGSIYIGTEHLFVGLLECSVGPARRALASCGATELAVKDKIEQIIGPPEPPDPLDDLPPVPRVNNALERAVVEARVLGHQVVTPEHLLLALIGDKETVATNVLLWLGVDLNHLAVVLASEAGWPHKDIGGVS